MAMVKSNYGVLGLDPGVVGRLLRLLVGVAITAQITYSLATVTPSAAFLGMAFTYFAAVLIAFTAAHWILGEAVWHPLGLFNTFMMAKGVPDGLLFGALQSLVLKGGVQPHVAGVVAVLSVLAGVVLGFIHQNASLLFVRMTDSSD